MKLRHGSVLLVQASRASEKEVTWLAATMRLTFGNHQLSLFQGRVLETAMMEVLCRLSVRQDGNEFKLFLKIGMAEPVADLLQEFLRITGHPMAGDVDVFLALGLLKARQGVRPDAGRVMARALAASEPEQWEETGERMAEANPPRVVSDLLTPISELLPLLVAETVVDLE